MRDRGVRGRDRGEGTQREGDTEGVSDRGGEKQRGEGQGRG